MTSFFFSCSESNPQTEKSEVKQISSADVEVSEINPNGDSELALLMRDMFDNAEGIKQDIISGEGTISKDYIRELARMHTAEPTDEGVQNEEFIAFGNLLIVQANILHETKEGQAAAFNSLVDRCIDCHHSFCPGPIKKITKLKIKE